MRTIMGEALVCGNERSILSGPKRNAKQLKLKKIYMVKEKVKSNNQDKSCFFAFSIFNFGTWNKCLLYKSYSDDCIQ